MLVERKNNSLLVSSVPGKYNEREKTEKPWKGVKNGTIGWIGENVDQEKIG